MSITQDIRTRARHRGKTPWQLVKTIGRLEREADETTCQMVELATENDRLRADRNRISAQYEEQAVANGATIDRLTVHRNELLRELTALKARFGPVIAAEANASAITVPPMARIGADQDTIPQGIDVTTLQAAAAAGLLKPVTDPGAVPDLGNEDTQPIPTP
ncbi:hypothetical protein [Streptomyces prasinus]|uniref:hypothetical protein n=1 Tax=Streptomyces prasinus TaxID=67345 RepID=UPI0033B036B2